MPRLSIIIPVLGSSGCSFPRPEHPFASRNATADVMAVETTLVSVLENRPTDCEIIVVHDAPYDDPYDLAAEVRFLPVGAGTGLVESINQAIDASVGAFIHVLAAGFEVTEGWTDAALVHFADCRVGSVAPLIVNSLDSPEVVAAGVKYSCGRGRVVAVDLPDSATALSGHRNSHGDIVGPVVHAAFYRRSALELAGGLPTAVGDQLADVDLALAFRFAGYRSVLERRSIVVAPDGCPTHARAWFRQGLLSERLFWRAAPIAGWGRSLLAHPWGALTDFIRLFPRTAAFSMLLGRMLGACQMGSHRANQKRLTTFRRNAEARFRPESALHVRVDGPHLHNARSPDRAGCISARAGA